MADMDFHPVDHGHGEFGERADLFRRAAKRTRAGSFFSGLIGKLIDRKFIRLLEQGLSVGSLDLTLPDGTRKVIRGDQPGPHADLILMDWRGVRRTGLAGTVGAAKGYIEEDWHTSDVAAFIELAARNRKSFGNHFSSRGLMRVIGRLRHSVRRNSKRGSRRNIEFHYDLGNEFYSAWLDPTMTYSSARFAADDQPLEEAQRNKYRALLKAIDPKPGEHILEIGCGWGGFAEIAASEFGVQVTGITLSTEQLTYAEARIARAGLKDKVTFKLIDYRDMDGEFDHIASIEMFEAVGEAYWPSFFAALKRLKKPEGRAGLQVITIDDEIFPQYRASADFIQTYIFPGGMLPSPVRLRQETAAAELEWQADDWFALDYAKTLRLWDNAFLQAKADGALPEGVDPAFERIWRFYLGYCEGGFRAGSTDVAQILLK